MRPARQDEACPVCSVLGPAAVRTAASLTGCGYGGEALRLLGGTVPLRDGRVFEVGELAHDTFDAGASRAAAGRLSMLLQRRPVLFNFVFHTLPAFGRVPIGAKQLRLKFSRFCSFSWRLAAH